MREHFHTGRAIVEAQPSSVKTCNSVNIALPSVAKLDKDLTVLTDRYNLQRHKRKRQISPEMKSNVGSKPINTSIILCILEKR